MKLFIVLAAVALAQAAKLDRTYLPPNAQASAGSAFLEAPLQSNGFQDQSGAFPNNGFANNAQNGAYSGFEARPVERAQAAFERNAAILRQDNFNDGETYAYAYETENGISGEENGVATNGVQAQGSYSYTGDDGKVYSVRYTADENGFQPQGDHLPTPPPIPAEILKALEQNARDEAAGIYDDGTYSDAKYADDSQQQYYDSNAQSNYNSAQSNYNPAQSNYNSAQSNYNNADAVITTSALIRNDASGSSSNVAGTQKAYLPPFAQANTDAIVTNNALRNDDGSSSSISGVQNSYLPPFGQRQRNGARPSFNARDGYRY
ncbi:pupal cuticle protein 36a-like [Spodoptera frugiperda]|uniref:Pupal cuticle protein 36a-like n=1 Tax=Spodoptera frugiperda TaxID=7108 RepID=A0A9R0DPX7_SPOFR|nr:pupal cuticle protein 36a-like [Spodoptera frugiperda]